MKYLFLSSLLQSVAFGPVFGLCMDSMLQRKPNAPSKMLRLLPWYCAAVLVILYNLFLRDFNQIANYGAIVLLLITAGVSFRLFYEGSVRYKWLTLLVLFIGMISSESLTGFLLLMGAIPTPKDLMQPVMVLVSFLGAIISCTCMFFAAVLWRRFRLHVKMPRGSWVFVLTTFCLVIPTVLYSAEVYHNDRSASPLHLLSMLSAVLMNFLMIWIQLNQAEKEKAERELLLLQHQAELERQQYQAMEQRREEMAKIRHDFNNLLSSVLILLRQNKPEEAAQAVAELVQRVESTKEYPYCGIPIVNAILSQKHAQCRSSGIELRTDLIFPAQTHITPIDLCSIFANLLDNAIRACSQLPEGAAPVISLSSRLHGDYLLIHCSNPTHKLPGSRPEGTGYGTKILRDIADRCSGDLQISCSEGVFSVKLILLNRP